MEDGDEKVVDGEVENESGGGTVGERESYGLSSEIDAKRMEKGLEEEVREGEEDEVVSGVGDGGVLAREEKKVAHGEPEKRDRE